MKLYLARHTETNFNVLGLSNSDPAVDVHLTPTGLKQAEALAEKLKHTPLDVIITSLLPRTIQTADIINHGRDLPLLSDGRLNDLNAGYEGRPASDYYAALSLEQDMWTAKFNRGESLDEVRERVGQFIDSLRKLPYHHILIVSHLTILQFLYGQLERMDKAEMLKVDIVQGGFKILEL